jgi:hypothetical protein
MAMAEPPRPKVRAPIRASLVVVLMMRDISVSSYEVLFSILGALRRGKSPRLFSLPVSPFKVLLGKGWFEICA